MGFRMTASMDRLLKYNTNTKESNKLRVAKPNNKLYRTEMILDIIQREMVKDAAATKEGITYGAGCTVEAKSTN